MITYDVVVAGAGPAGSTAARLLAERGASVLLLDKQRFPRDKPCGGGVTLRAAAVPDIDISPVIERTIPVCILSVSPTADAQVSSSRRASGWPPFSSISLRRR